MTNETTTIKLGQKVRDTLSGLEGTVIAVTEWMYGCRRIMIQPSGNKDGKPFEPFTIDEPQCELMADPEVAPVPESPRRHGNRDDSVAQRRAS